jgi:hypothetical protein
MAGASERPSMPRFPPFSSSHKLGLLIPNSPGTATKAVVYYVKGPCV